MLQALSVFLQEAGMIQAEKIREHVGKSFAETARAAGFTHFVVEARHVHKDLKLKSRFPAICSAIDARSFRHLYHVALVNRTGPLQGSTVTWTFKLL
jgi:hypothetical protein